LSIEKEKEAYLTGTVVERRGVCERGPQGPGVTGQATVNISAITVKIITKCFFHFRVKYLK
jgi:hypothetical protein